MRQIMRKRVAGCWMLARVTLKKLTAKGPWLSRSWEAICTSWVNSVKLGATSPAFSARFLGPDAFSLVVARFVVSIAARGALYGGTPDSKVFLNSSDSLEALPLIFALSLKS